ncbi:N-acyl-D-glucosamine 2-epimerase [Actinomycetota bacterium]|nr:N-acyl-D-glucosamine 2-epimerase [Actinomycetota bacterium]
MTNIDHEFLVDQAQNLLIFGANFGAPNGGAGWLNDDRSLSLEHGVETWITSRMVHSYSLAKLSPDLENNYKGKSADELINEGLKGLTEILTDSKNGGCYAKVNVEGIVIDQTKAAYAHAFVILASSSAALAGNAQALDLLPKSLTLFNEKFWDEKYGLSVDNYPISDWSELDSYRGINANMHTVEAFLAASDVLRQIDLGSSELLKPDLWLNRAGQIVDHVVEWAPKFGNRVPEHFNSEWIADPEFNADKKADQFKPYGATVGHGLEWARLIAQYGLAVRAQDPSADVKKYIDTAVALFEAAVDEGWDLEIGGFYYTTDWEGKPVVKDRMHWVEAEGINTAATLFEITGQPKYHEWFEKIWRWTLQNLVDESGSWKHQLNDKNEHVSDVWPGKPDIYHALQACLIPLYKKNKSIASACKTNQKGDF